jgi:TetR/AcrR family transcriptional regulator
MKSKRQKAVEASVPSLNASAEQLIDATAALLSQRSDLNVSIADIAKHSGLNSALIKYYFKNKEGLLLALLERDARRHMEGLTRLLEMDVGAERKLSIHIGAIFKAYSHSRYLNRLIHYMLEHAEPELGVRVADIFVKPIYAAYKKIIEQGVSEGVFRRVDSGWLYFSLIGACDHVFVSARSVNALTGHEKLTKKLLEAYVSHVTETFLRGIAANAETPIRGQSRATSIRSKQARAA